VTAGETWAIFGNTVRKSVLRKTLEELGAPIPTARGSILYLFAAGVDSLIDEPRKQVLFALFASQDQSSVRSEDRP
jgi:hypothetical protein